LMSQLHSYAERIRGHPTTRRTGTLVKVLPTALRADGPSVPIGTLCEIDTSGDRGSQRMIAEVVGIDTEGISLVPLASTGQLVPGAQVFALSSTPSLPVGDAFIGRVIDALAAPLDGLPPPIAAAYHELQNPPSNPLDLTADVQALETGIRAIDGLLSLGQGQRIGIFAASGVGKTSLVNQLARQVAADVTVLCLVGERGREVEALWSRELTSVARARSTIVAATADQPAALRVRAVYQALALAIHWRERGRHVLLIIDSITRLAHAMRETGLAAGEPPTVRAYTPNVFSAIPRIVESCGAFKSGGAISAVVTVLAETDDVDDPICELMKSLLDGHIILSRSLAESGHFPAIDILKSVSRLVDTVRGPSVRVHAAKIKTAMADYEASKMLIETGLYVAGSDKRTDEAIAGRPKIDAFLVQRQDERVSLDQTSSLIMKLSGEF
jgi:flagellum-specific ATP synthase